MYLDRVDALHAVDVHYRWANWSICRFTSHIHAEYAVDAIFEIDAHVKGFPGWFLDYEFYEPIIRAAVTAGHRIYRFLVDDLCVDPRFITLLVSRMGCRVTVDWRAFGPRRLWQVLTVVRWIEAQVFGDGDLEKIEKCLGETMVPHVDRLREGLGGVVDAEVPTGEITCHVCVDTGIYAVSDNARITSEDGNAFMGPFIRPVGALHSLSSPMNMYIRATPVPHHRFHPDHSEWLTRVSRSPDGPEVRRFAEPRLFIEAWRLPEARCPRADCFIEGHGSRPRIPPSGRLLDLFTWVEELLGELPEDFQEKVQKMRQRRLQHLSSSGEFKITPEVLEDVVSKLGVRYRKRGDHYRMDCPYCERKDRSASLYIESGVFMCGRCRDRFGGGVSLHQLAQDHNLGHLVPARPASSTLLKYEKLADLPNPRVTEWEDLGRVVSGEFETIQDAREAMTSFLREQLGRDDWDSLVLLGPTGLGKTTTTLREIRQQNLTAKGLFARTESRLPLVVELDGRPIDGRREEQNCQNPAVQDAIKLHLPTWTVCGSQCPHHEGCPYLEQFGDLKDESIALVHAHLPFVAIGKFDNGAEVTFIDENPWTTSYENVDIRPSEIDLFRTSHTIEFPGLDERLSRFPFVDDDCQGVDVGLDDPFEVRWRGTTRQTEALLQRLEAILQSDSILTQQVRQRRQDWYKAPDVIADYNLARLMSQDAELFRLLDEIDDADIEQHEGEVISLFLDRMRTPDDEREQVRPPPKRVLRDLIQALRALSLLRFTGFPSNAPVHALRDDGAWVLRLPLRRNLPVERFILASSTIRPEQFRLAFGTHHRLLVFEPRVRKREYRTLIADRQFGLHQLTKKNSKLQPELFETVKALIATEYKRTQLPVAVIGRAMVVNKFNEFMLGQKLGSRLSMPFRTSRDERMAELRAMTEAHHYISGYAGGVAGSNDFAVEHEGEVRFVRSLIILGGLIPPLQDVASELRGVLAGDERWEAYEADGVGTLYRRCDRLVDWSVVYRTVPIPGTELGQGEARTVLTAQNVLGFADPIANELLHGLYESEFVQIAGRMRGGIDDPVDATIEPKLWIFAHVAIPGFEIDHPLGFDDLRATLGLAATNKKRGRPRKLNGPEMLARRLRRDRRGTIERLVRALVEHVRKTGSTFDPTHSRAAATALEAMRRVREAGTEPTEGEIQFAFEIAQRELEPDIRSQLAPQKSLKVFN